MRILVVANQRKTAVAAELDRLLPSLKKKVDVVGVDGEHESGPITVEANAILVLGGDGTLLAAARRLRGRQIPLLGVNYGRLGFLASFTPKQFERHLDDFVAGKLPVSARVGIEASVVPPGANVRLRDLKQSAKHRRFIAPALNDAVITAGPPFHMIELEIAADGGGDQTEGGTGISYFGDGVIVSTASGSTAYNVSAGGPIISPNVEAMCVTPLCPHSLSFRPVVISSHSTVVIRATKVNEGTTLFCDGQESTRLLEGERVVISRAEQPVLLVENPESREWHTLAAKLHWAINPAYNDPGEKR